MNVLCQFCGRRRAEVTHYDSGAVQGVGVLLIQHELVLWLDTLTGDLSVVEKPVEGLRGYNTPTNSLQELPMAEVQLVAAEKAVQPTLRGLEVPLDPRGLNLPSSFLPYSALINIDPQGLVDLEPHVQVLLKAPKGRLGTRLQDPCLSLQIPPPEGLVSYTRLQVGYTGNLTVTGSFTILLHLGGLKFGLPLRRREIFCLQLGALISGLSSLAMTCGNWGG